MTYLIIFLQVSKEKTITTTRDVEKSREVVRIKKNKLSLLQRILKYPPNYVPEPVQIEIPIEVNYDDLE
jgi:hypothetical protein